FISWISGGNLTVHSTSKMLIGVTAAAVVTLGGNDLFLGYKLFLAAVVVAGIIQFSLGLLRLGIIGELIPATVIKSLLAAVGVIIIVKQIPVLVGVEIHLKNIIDLALSVPEIILHLNPIIAFIGLLSTAIMFLHSRTNFPVIKAIPAAVWVIIVAQLYSHLLGFKEGGSFNILGSVYGFDKSFLISLPDEITQAIVHPDFSAWQTGDFWTIVLAVVLISSVEGILSTKAIDRLDPLKRKSNVNKELGAIGLGTALSGMLGGLPVIPGIVSTSVGVNHNGKGQLTNVFQAVIILLLIVLLGSELQIIPLAALSGILIHTGYKLLNPAEIKNIYRIGWDQFLVFTITLITTLTTDLLIGIAVGTTITLSLHIIRLKSISKLLTILFRPNVVVYEEDEENKFYVSVKGYSNFLNYQRLKNALDLIPNDASVNLDVSLTDFIDHTVMEHLKEYEESHIRKGGSFEIIGLDNHLTAANHPLATRLKILGTQTTESPETLTSRQLKLQQFAKENALIFEPTIARFPNDFNRFRFFRSKNIDKSYNQLYSEFSGFEIHIQDIDFHEGEFQTRVNYHATVAIVELNNIIPQFTLEKENLFDQIAALSGYDDIDFKNFKHFSNKFKLKGKNETDVRKAFTHDLLSFLEENLNYRIESTGSHLLIMGKERPFSQKEISAFYDFLVQLLPLLKSSTVL
ncbi:SulP family inorganic anion transporter, partial [Bacteroidota bacterium]